MNEILWYAQKLIMLQNNNLIWSWTSDHLSMENFDNNGFTWIDAFHNLMYDWTHANSIFFDQINNHVYISLSELKYKYNTSGEIISSIGLPVPYMSNGDSNLCNEAFSFQHHVQKLDNAINFI